MTLDRTQVPYRNFKIGFGVCYFDIPESAANSENFYKCAVMLDAIYNIKLVNSAILTIESMRNKLAKLL